MKILYQHGYNPAKMYTFKRITADKKDSTLLIEVEEQKEPLWATEIWFERGMLEASCPENY